MPAALPPDPSAPVRARCMVEPALLRAFLCFAASQLVAVLVVRRGPVTPSPAAVDWDLAVDTSPANCACLPASFDYCVEPLAAALVDVGALGANVCYEFRFHLVVVLFGGLCFALGRLTAPSPLRRPDVRRGPAAHHPGRSAD